jgi:hypothetical protein
MEVPMFVSKFVDNYSIIIEFFNLYLNLLGYDGVEVPVFDVEFLSGKSKRFNWVPASDGMKITRCLLNRLRKVHSF